MEFERHGNTYVFDPESATEMARLIALDRAITSAMGGPLQGVPRLPRTSKVLDVACGPGGWVLDVARKRPHFEVAGIDVSQAMLSYAHAQAHAQRIKNASFEAMDITEPLAFSDATFDFVNARLLVGVLHREAWQPFLQECQRILKPGGVLRLTEPINIGVTSSVAHEKIMALLYHHLWELGYGFSADGSNIGLGACLPSMLRTLGYQEVQLQGHALDFSAGTPTWTDIYEDQKAWAVQAETFFAESRVVTPEEITRLYQQMLLDMQGPEFCGMGYFISTLARKAA